MGVRTCELSEMKMVQTKIKYFSCYIDKWMRTVHLLRDFFKLRFAFPDVDLFAVFVFLFHRFYIELLSRLVVAFYLRVRI